MIHDGIAKRNITDLTKSEADPAISIYVPTVRAGVDVTQGRIKLKNLLTRAENLLVERGMRHTLAIDFLKPASDLDANAEFWNDRLDSIAFFISPGRMEVFHLPFETPELLSVGTRFSVRPIVQMLNSCRSWYVLAIDKHNVRLVHCGPRGATEERVEHMPGNIEGFTTGEHAHDSSRLHSVSEAGLSGALVGSAGEDKGALDTDRLHRFCIAVSRAVETHLHESSDPIVLAGAEEDVAVFSSITHLKHVLKDAVVGSPKMLDALALRTSSVAFVEEFSDLGRQTAMARYREMAGTGLTSQQIEEIMPAAANGKVDVLFTSDTAAVWGTFEGASGKTTVHREATLGDEDLLNEAAIATLINGGIVYSVTTEELALTGPAATTFRY